MPTVHPPRKVPILCATDFSPPSRTALAYALLLANARGSSVHLVHAYAFPLTVASGLDTEPYRRAMKNAVEDAMGAFVRSLGETPVPVAPHTMPGAAATSVVDAAAAWECDLIALGVSGSTALSRALIGSVADRVLRTSPLPVLSAPALDATPTRIESILCAVDFSVASKVALDTAVRLARELGAHLHVAHVHEISGLTSTPSRVDDEGERESVTQLDQLVAGRKGDDVEITSHVVRGVPYRSLVDLSQQLGANLVVTGTHGKAGWMRHMLGSVADRMIRTSPIPILTVPSRV